MAGPNTVVEASWEVVNKVGGINTVIRSKAELLVKKYAHYLLVGPLFPGKHEPEFTEQAPPERLRNIFEELRQEGISCVYGVWKIPGNPATVLIDAQHSHIHVDNVKGMLWERFGVDTLHAAGDYDEPLRWSWAVGRFLELFSASRDETIVAQFHEWMAGLGLLYLKSKKSNVRTVFTTHATMLGRTISANTDINLYESLDSLDPQKLAKELSVVEKFTTEVACATHADVFTTVSEITGLEAHALLGRKPDVLLFNGILNSHYPTLEETSILHMRSREKIRDFLHYYFFSHYTLDLEQSLTFFVSGRYEYRNKGLDVLTQALSRLNQELKHIPDSKTIVVFFFIPQDTQGVKTEVLEARAAFTNLQEFLEQHSSDIVRTLLRNAHNIENMGCGDLLSQEAKQQIKQLSDAMIHAGNPPLITHNISYEEGDPIVAGFRAHGLLNREEDKVKVIRYPLYLTGSDGLLDLTYDEAVAGSHLGIFPSYYEPWGYTPVETLALGVPSVTTDLAGFGRFVLENKQDGAFVVKRQNRSPQQVADELFEVLKEFSLLDKYGRQDKKIAAKKLSALVDWEIFIKYYYQAHLLAYESSR